MRLKNRGSVTQLLRQAYDEDPSQYKDHRCQAMSSNLQPFTGNVDVPLLMTYSRARVQLIIW